MKRADRTGTSRPEPAAIDVARPVVLPAAAPDGGAHARSEPVDATSTALPDRTVVYTKRARPGPAKAKPTLPAETKPSAPAGQDAAGDATGSASPTRPDLTGGGSASPARRDLTGGGSASPVRRDLTGDGAGSASPGQPEVARRNAGSASPANPGAAPVPGWATNVRAPAVEPVGQPVELPPIKVQVPAEAPDAGAADAEPPADTPDGSDPAPGPSGGARRPRGRFVLVVAAGVSLAVAVPVTVAAMTGALPGIGAASPQRAVGLPDTTPGPSRPVDYGWRPPDYPPSPPPAGPASGTPGGEGQGGATSPRQPAPAKPPPPGFTAVTGESCGRTSTRGYYRSGWSSGWYKRSSGGWTGDGCGGEALSVPMSGSATRDDNDNVVVWWFRTGPVTRGQCAVSVYVPNTGNAKDAAGKPAHYIVYPSTDARGTPAAEFDVDQAGNRGRWVAAGTFPVTDAQLSVRMVTRGIDWGSGREGDHLGASALKADCRAG